jgi:hypothetical protein
MAGYIAGAALSITIGPLSSCVDTVQIKDKSEPVPDGNQFGFIL